jgi:AcrR family transcriptional regulator
MTGTGAGDDVRSGRRGPYRKGEATRAKVLDAARDCVAEVGFASTTMREIARRSGVTSGAIQHHFGSFEAMLLATVEAGVHEIVAAVDVDALPDEPTGTRVERIIDLVWAHYERPEYLAFLDIYINLMRDPNTSERARRSLAASVQELEQLWYGLLDQTFGPVPAQRREVIRRMAFATLRGLAISRWFAAGQADFADERRLLAEFVTACAAPARDGSVTGRGSGGSSRTRP